MFDMNYEKGRIETFKGWPVPYINVRELAANGFYYCGNDDYVQCNFCQFRVHNFEADWNINELHNKYAGFCPLNLGMETDNVKLNKNGSDAGENQ
jgi:hypothetical protein